MPIWQGFGRWGGLGGFAAGGSGGANDPNFSLVKLLLGVNGADAATATTDESPAAHGAASFTGNAQLDTAQFKFGTSSLLLDGTVDSNISYLDSADWHFTSSDQWTIEAWVRFTTVAPSQCIIAQWAAGARQSWLFEYSTGGGPKLRFAYSTNGTNTTDTQGTWTPSINTWYHVAADCDATNKLRVYADGVMIASRTSVPSFYDGTNRLTIGQFDDDVGGSIFNRLNGWIDEVRITKGAARYASDGGYTVPALAFPRS